MKAIRRLPPFDVFCRDVLGLDLSTRRTAMILQRAFDGAPLDDEARATFAAYTGGLRPRPGGWPYMLQLVGRQAGKTETAAARLCYAAVGAVLAGQRNVACVGMAQDARAAVAVLFDYVARFFEQPLLRGLVASRTRDTIMLRGNVRVIVLPCRPAAIRGLRCSAVVLDEIAHFRSSENIPLDREMWRAALGTLLTTGGRLVALTSPYVASGLAYDLHREHFGRVSDVLVWQSANTVLHPTLDAAALAQLRAVDATGAAAEIDGQFLRHVSALLDEESLAGAVDHGVTVRAPGSHSYAGFVDVATGTRVGNDAMAFAVAHAEGRIGVLDAMLVVRPPFSPESAARQVAELARAYGVTTIAGDAFAGGFSHEAFKRAGLRYEAAPASKSEIYLWTAAALQSGAVRLLDHPGLLAELRGLERRRGPTRDLVDHRRGAHDDAANAACGAVMLAMQAARQKRARRLTWGSASLSDVERERLALRRALLIHQGRTQ